MSKERPNDANIPFEGGPRHYTGKNLSLLETHQTLVMRLKHFRSELMPGSEVKTESKLSLRLKVGLRMRLKPA
jgi:cytochrome P450